MKFSRDFYKLTLADFIVRSGYQMGKTPLLPILAASLGASDVLLGMIVSISTLTGMVSKPIFGFLSDRQGRRWWIILGTLFFAAIPFFYQWIETPAQLVLIRVIHGTATAIYGPVTVAFIAERSGRRTAEHLGWFDMARSGGYIVGPLMAGGLLLFMDPATVFTVIGLISCAAFVPVLMLREDRGRQTTDDRQPTKDEGRKTNVDLISNTQYPISNTQRFDNPSTNHYALRTIPSRMRHAFRIFLAALRIGARTPAVWLSGIMEATVYVALYAAKAFLPIYALTAGYNTAQIGLFFSVQEGVHLLTKPFGGRVGDRLGHARSIALGMTALAAAMPLLTVAANFWGLLALAVVVGMAQALIFPNTMALVTEQISPIHLGAGMGLVGTFENLGKVIGPVLGGLLIAQMDYQSMFWLMGALMLIGALTIQILWWRQPKRIAATH
jgi:MFS family permease